MWDINEERMSLDVFLLSVSGPSSGRLQPALGSVKQLESLNEVPFQLKLRQVDFC